MFRKLAVTLAVVSLGIPVLAAPKTPKAQPRPNVLLISLGQVRADAAAKAPFLRQLQSRGAVYASCSSPSDNPTVSTFSLLTGYQADVYYSATDRAEISLAAQLRRIGYRTVGVTAHPNLRPNNVRAVSGFERYLNLNDLWTVMSDEKKRERFPALDERLQLYGRETSDFNRLMMFSSASEVRTWTERALEGSEPFFLWLQFDDAHDPYVPDPAFYDPTKEKVDVPPMRSRLFSRDVAKPDTIPDPDQRELVEDRVRRASSRAWATALELSPAQMEVFRARYEAEVLDVDRALESLFTMLEREQLLDSTIVVIASTNGEEFGESGLLTHSFNELGDPTATRQVPLLMLFPKHYALRNATLPARCSITDIAPTLYDVLGIDAAPLYTNVARLHGTSHADRLGIKRKYETKATNPPAVAFGPDDREVTIRSQQDATARRKELVRKVWNADRLPDVRPSITKDVCSPIPDVVNLARVDHLTSRVGQVESEGHHFVPAKPNGELVIVQVGHGCAPLDDALYMDTAQGTSRTVAGLLAAGYGVVALRMPLQRPADCGGPAAHVALFTAGGGAGMRYFLEPVLAAVNELGPAYRAVHMTGLSGGGWTTALYAAIDPRVTRSVQIAGSTPLYLRSARARGDIEEIVPEIYSLAGYLDLYVLAATGAASRSHLQVLIRQDSCCFRAIDAPDAVNFERDTFEYEARVQSATAAAGGGSFELAVDGETPLHAISGYGFVEYVLPALSGDL